MVKKIKKYSYNAKIRLRDRVECLPKKSQFIKVYNIITPKSYTENNNGILIYFHNLSNETYRDLEIFLDDVDDNDIDNPSFVRNLTTFNSVMPMPPGINDNAPYKIEG